MVREPDKEVLALLFGERIKDVVLEEERGYMGRDILTLTLANGTIIRIVADGPEGGWFEMSQLRGHNG